MLVHERRFFAMIIDIGLVLVLSLVTGIFIPGALTSTVLFLSIFFVINFIYMTISLLITKDTTIGLYLMSLKLLSKNWDKIDKKTIFIRALVHGVPAFYLVSILYMLLNKTQETYFDVLSNSFVVKTGDAYDGNSHNRSSLDNKSN